jgi:hypothetical protein
MLPFPQPSADTKSWLAIVDRIRPEMGAIEDLLEPGEPISSIAVARDYLRRRFVLLSQNLTQQE